jgi:hypothetical protein
MASAATAASGIAAISATTVNRVVFPIDVCMPAPGVAENRPAGLEFESY